MPDMMPPGMTPPGGGPPGPGMTGQPPMGSSPMGMKTAGPGHAASGMAMLRKAIELMQLALPALPIGSDAYKACHEAMGKLLKAAPAQEAAPGVDQTALRGLVQNAQNLGPLQALMRQGPGPGGPGAGGPGGGPPPGVPG